MYLRQNRRAHKVEAKMEAECWQRHRKAAQLEYWVRYLELNTLISCKGNGLPYFNAFCAMITCLPEVSCFHQAEWLHSRRFSA
jgi:hypothetical protein